MAQMQNVHNPQEESFKPRALAGSAVFCWFLTFTAIPDPVLEDYFEVKATVRIEGTTMYALDSLPVQATYGKITLTFPPLPQKSQSVGEEDVEDYRGKATSIVNNVDQLNNSIHITLNRPAISGARPTVWLNACTIDQQWLIGARDILLVEPPSAEIGVESGKVMSASS